MLKCRRNEKALEFTSLVRRRGLHLNHSLGNNGSFVGECRFSAHDVKAVLVKEGSRARKAKISDIEIKQSYKVRGKKAKTRIYWEQFTL